VEGLADPPSGLVEEKPDADGSLAVRRGGMQGISRAEAVDEGELPRGNAKTAATLVSLVPSANE
jgi:hypothetical protein